MQAVQSALQTVKGVERAKVSLAKHNAVVTYDPGVVKVDDLISAVDHCKGMAHFTASLPAKGKGKS